MIRDKNKCMDIGNYLNRDEMVTALMDMIRLASYQGIPGQETETAKYIQRFFLKEGIHAELIHVRDQRYNIIARMAGENPGKSILLTGHTDTVPPYDFKRALEPYIESSRIYGRGANDMKGPLVSMMFAMAAIKRAGGLQDGQVIFAGVIDEELLSYGTKKLLEDGFCSDYAVVGEPSNLKIYTGHKGLEWFDVYFIGKEAHGGAYKEGVNAIAMASKFIEKVQNELAPKVFSRVHPGTGEATINIGYIKGGTQPSSIPGECLVRLDRRFIPGEKYEDVVKEIEDILVELKTEDSNFNYKLVAQDRDICGDGYIHPPMTLDSEDPLVMSLQKSIAKVINQETDLGFFPAWTDGGLLCQAGIKTLVFGPGNIKYAHTDEEHIEIDDMFWAAGIYADLALEMTTCK